MKITKNDLKKLIMEELEKVEEVLPRDVARRARPMSKRVPGGGTLKIKNAPKHDDEKDPWEFAEYEPLKFEIVKLDKVVGSKGEKKSNLAYPGYYVVGERGDMEGPFQSEEEAKQFVYKHYSYDK
jgi:hypothetical protein